MLKQYSHKTAMYIAEDFEKKIEKIIFKLIHSLTNIFISKFLLLSLVNFTNILNKIDTFLGLMKSSVGQTRPSAMSIMC